MRILAIETATEACSVALFDGTTLLGARHETLGRGHAERLVPLIAELPGRGQAEEIRVSLGPGSFTGTRIGIAAARALGLAWQAQVLGYPTLALVAAMARGQHGDVPLGVAMNGGHGEWFVQRFDAAGLPLAAHASVDPDAAIAALPDELVAGNRADDLVGRRGSGRAIESLPDARAVLSLPVALLTAALAPIYGRPPDAKVPGAKVTAA